MLLSSTIASAHVLDAKGDKVLFKLRADVAKQVTGYTLCLMKAASKCETQGVLSSPECDLSTGAVAYEPTPGTQTVKFQAAIAKCDAKQDLDKKGTDYAGIGCPGDCDAAPGVQQCGTLAAYEAALEVADGVKGQIGMLAVLVDGGCASTGAPDGKARIACVRTGIKQLSKYFGVVSKCAQKCELDLTGKKGGGATTNAGVCLVGDEDVHPSVTECEAKAALKLTQPAASITPAVTAILNATTDALFNGEDPTDPDSPAGTLSPCGTCGDGIREGTERCDGSDLGLCDVCNPDCSCGVAVCGNGVIEGDEACDGAALGECDACAGDCTCTEPVCGNGILESGEACDGEALGECGACASDCSCVIDPILDGPAGTFCSTAIDPSTANYQPLCVPTAGSGRHFRMEGIYMGLSDNGFVYLALGFPSGLESTATNPATPTAGDGRFIFTAGKSVSCNFSWNYFRYSAITSPAANPCSVPAIFDGFRDASDVPPPAHPGPGTVCLDVTDDNPPRVTFWATGANGANCKDKASLTAATALYSKDDWASADDQPIHDATHYAKISNIALATMTSVSVSSNTVLP
ncbi:MAG: hypothetical protein KIT14_24455 [bacterium]|nr:hypothetical protein [bacterium]